MNRRTFLKRATTGAAVAASSGSIAMAGFDWFMEENPSYTPERTVNYPVFEKWVDYTNFSDVALSGAIDGVVAAAAEELGRAHGMRIQNLYRAVMEQA